MKERDCAWRLVPYGVCRESQEAHPENGRRRTNDAPLHESIEQHDIRHVYFESEGTTHQRRRARVSKTLHNGSMYSASVTTGDLEAFVAPDVVGYIDAHYVTIPSRQKPRPRRALDGRLRHQPHRDETR
jgi:hypothetical protein